MKSIPKICLCISLGFACAAIGAAIQSKYPIEVLLSGTDYKCESSGYLTNQLPVKKTFEASHSKLVKLKEYDVVEGVRLSMNVSAVQDLIWYTGDIIDEPLSGYAAVLCKPKRLLR